jgi:hypothetical protein
MMPTPQLREFERRLFALKSCFQLARPDLERDPLCPHCGFRPAEEPASAASAKQTVADLDEALDALAKGWTETLYTNLEDPTVSRNIGLVSDATGKLELQNFLTSKQLPDPVSTAFVKALQEVLRGLERVSITRAELEAALSTGGLPCTVGELRERFDHYVAGLTKGKDVSKVRLVIE